MKLIIKCLFFPLSSIVDNIFLTGKVLAGLKIFGKRTGWSGDKDKIKLLVSQDGIS